MLKGGGAKGRINGVAEHAALLVYERRGFTLGERAANSAEQGCDSAKHAERTLHVRPIHDDTPRKSKSSFQSACAEVGGIDPGQMTYYPDTSTSRLLQSYRHR